MLGATHGSHQNSRAGRSWDASLTKMGKVVTVSRSTRRWPFRRDGPRRASSASSWSSSGTAPSSTWIRRSPARRDRYVDLSGVEPDERTIDAMPAENAKAYQLSRSSTTEDQTPQGRDQEPDNFQAVDDLRLLMGFRVEAVVAARQIDALLEKHYAKSESLGRGQRARVGRSVRRDGGFQRSVDRPRGGPRRRGRQPGHQAPEPGAAPGDQGSASDIHLEPFENEFKIRYRIDGVLYEMVPRPSTSARRSLRASRSWRIWTSPSGVSRRTDASSSPWAAAPWISAWPCSRRSTARAS